MKKNEAKKAVKLSLTKDTVANLTTKSGIKAGQNLSISFVHGKGGLCCA